MNYETTKKLILPAGLALALVLALGWNRDSSAQYLQNAKGGAGGGKGWYGEFANLLGTQGDKNMLLEAHVLTAKEGELIGKVVGSTDAFLVLKAQNQRDLYYITWDDVVWVTARPN